MSVIVFPGQGSQYQEMAMDFNKNFDYSRAIFEEIEDYTKINIRKIISDNNDDQLNQTIFTQISIFATSIVIYKTLLNEIGLVRINPKIVLGHSLGEYSALVANNVLSINQGALLIKKRGELMNSAIQPNISGMAAVLGKSSEIIDKIIKENNLNIEVANDNSPMQVVVSGLIEDINKAKNFFISNGVKKFVKLNVSAAFHSKYMSEAQDSLINEINKIKFKSSDIPIISNFNALININVEDIIFALSHQMANQVKWTESIKKLEETMENQIIEVGPGKVLSGLISRISKKFDIKSIDKVEDLNNFRNS